MKKGKRTKETIKTRKEMIKARVKGKEEGREVEK